MIFTALSLTCACSGGESTPFISSDNSNDIQSEWLWPCADISGQSQNVSFQIHENYDSGMYTGIYNIYASNNCTGSVQATNTATGTYTIGADFDTYNTPSLVATEIDFDLPTVTSTGASEYTQILDQIVIWDTGGQFYDIFYVNNSQLFWGDHSTGDSTTPQARPTTIDLSVSAMSI